MSVRNLFGEDININGFPICILRTPQNHPSMKAAIEYIKNGGTAKVIVSETVSHLGVPLFVAHSTWIWDKNNHNPKEERYHFPKSLVHTSNGYEIFKDSKDRIFEENGIISMTSECAIFRSLLDVIIFFNDKELCVNGMKDEMHLIAPIKIVPSQCLPRPKSIENKKENAINVIL